MSEDNTLEVEIYNEIGIKFQENKFFPLKKGIHFVSFDVWDLPNGLYFLKIKNNTEINSIKFVKIN